MTFLRIVISLYNGHRPPVHSLRPESNCYALVAGTNELSDVGPQGPGRSEGVNNMAGFLSFLLNFFSPRSGSRAANVVPAFIDESGWPDWPAGSLPHSRNLSNVPLYRYQPKEYIEFGEGWYHMFWDVERKWAAQSRFAAPGISPGHFFSLHPDGALAEMKPIPRM
jgi:hypothetical protein